MTQKTATVASMTGFARTSGHHESLRWTLEARSVNSRSLDVRCRVPPGLEALDGTARSAAGKRFKRGAVGIVLTLAKGERDQRVRVNRAMLDQFLDLWRSLDVSDVAPPRFDGLLALRGVLEPIEEEDEDSRLAALQAMERDLGEVLDLLGDARREEGARLLPALESLLDTVETFVRQAGELAAAQPAGLKQRLRTQVEALLEASPALPEERLVQEAALLASKADIREELDRLGAHIAQARTLLAGGGVVGRRLDFLCQEFNREANTVCSKSADVTLTGIGLELKAAVEQFREQVQNIE